VSVIVNTLGRGPAAGKGRPAEFEAYARHVAAPIERCGGKVVGYFAPTKFAGPTHSARRVAQAGVILVEDRSFSQRVS
jgi:hypothetical protein